MSVNSSIFTSSLVIGHLNIDSWFMTIDRIAGRATLREEWVEVCKGGVYFDMHTYSVIIFVIKEVDVRQQLT